jgi:pimeloyl-ACP methyl ester carboxylesterase
MHSPTHTTRRVSGLDWDIRESGPSDAESTVLLLPGGMCTAVFFEPIMDALVSAPVHVVAATLPGFGRTPYTADLSVENYASLEGQLAGEPRAEIVGVTAWAATSSSRWRPEASSTAGCCYCHRPFPARMRPWNLVCWTDAHGLPVPRVCQSGVKSYVVFGDDDEIGLTDEERSGLEACADVTLVTVADATHGLIIEQPTRIAELILELVEKKTHI